MQFETRCVHVGVNKDSAYNSATTPIYPSSTFVWDDLESNKGYDYTRSANPTRRALEENIAALEGGIDCRATSTGMSAITTTMHFFSPGDHIIAGLAVICTQQGIVQGQRYRLLGLICASPLDTRALGFAEEDPIDGIAVAGVYVVLICQPGRAILSRDE